jgi:predicted esterase
VAYFRSSPIILLLHAVRADRSTMVSRAQLLLKHGFSGLLIDLQGHGVRRWPGINCFLIRSRERSSNIRWTKR